MSTHETKRLFFGMEIHAPWPDKLPFGRLLDPVHRHLTLAFLGHVSYQKLMELLSQLPRLKFKVGLTGKFDQCLFLPPHHPHVVAWHVDWLEDVSALLDFQSALVEWLNLEGFSVDIRPFMPHVTLARAPFNYKGWRTSFTPLPMIATTIHLFESVGHSHYTSLWHLPLHPPFLEIEHTADRAFLVYGESITQLFQHAQVALAFSDPSLLPFLISHPHCETVDDIVISLNEIICTADQEIGASLKAVSFHGNIQKQSDGTFVWEMIIDV